MLALITGGARSGKSRFAERYAACLGGKGIYIATSQIRDGEMEERVAKHRREREVAGFPWATVEEPLDLAGCLLRIAREEAAAVWEEGMAPVVLVDCLTLWLSNIILAPAGSSGWQEEIDYGDPQFKARTAERVEREIGRLEEVLRGMPLPVLLVTNEVGDGIVPEYPLGRLYRDLAGMMNRRLASVCGQVFLVTAGIPVELKSIAYRLPASPGSVERKQEG